MIGIVLISHDDFCVGMLHAAEMICGDLGGQIVTVGLAKDAPVETFDEALRRAVKTVDTGDGIVILADLAGEHHLIAQRHWPGHRCGCLEWRQSCVFAGASQRAGGWSAGLC